MLRITAVVIVLFLAGAMAHAASPYDGKWAGSAPANENCPVALKFDLTVSDGVLTGSIVGRITGVIGAAKVGADGVVNFVTGPTIHYPGALRFTGDRFEGTFNGNCPARPVSGTRSK